MAYISPCQPRCPKVINQCKYSESWGPLTTIEYRLTVFFCTVKLSMRAKSSGLTILSPHVILGLPILERSSCAKIVLFFFFFFFFFFSILGCPKADASIVRGYSSEYAQRASTVDMPREESFGSGTPFNERLMRLGSLGWNILDNKPQGNCGLTFMRLHGRCSYKRWNFSFSF